MTPVYQLSKKVTLAASLAAILINLLSRFLSGQLVDHVVLRVIVTVIHVISGWIILFAVPGGIFLFIFPGVRRRHCEMASTLLLLAFAWNISLLYAGTMVIKLFHIHIDATNLLLLSAGLCALGLLLSRGVNSIRFVDDLRFTRKWLLGFCGVLILLVLAYFTRFTVPLERLWEIEAVMRGTWFPELDIQQLITAVDATPNGNESVAQVNITLSNPDQSSQNFNLMTAVWAERNGIAEVCVNGPPAIFHPIPQSMGPYGATFGNRTFIREKLFLPEGESRVILRVRGASGDQVPFRYEDFSGLSRPTFIKRFSRLNVLTTIDSIYDSYEIRATSDSFRDRLFLWADEYATSVRKGYYILTPPLNWYFDMLTSILVASYPVGVSITAMVKIALSLAFGLLLLKTTAQSAGFASCSLIFCTALCITSVAISCRALIFNDPMMLILCVGSLHLLLQGETKCFLWVAIINAMVHSTALIFGLIIIGLYGLFYKKTREAWHLASVLFLVVLIYGVWAALVGYFNDLWPRWLVELKYEFLRIHTDNMWPGYTTAGNISRLITWVILGSCFTVLLQFMPVRRSREAWFLTVLFCVFLLYNISMAPKRVFRPHYFYTLSYIGAIAGLSAFENFVRHHSNCFKIVASTALISIGVISVLLLTIFPPWQSEYLTLLPGIYNLLGLGLFNY